MPARPVIMARVRFLNSAVIESKEETRKRGSEKPDRAEAVMLAFAPEIPREVHSIMYYHDPASMGPV